MNKFKVSTFFFLVLKKSFFYQSHYLLAAISCLAQPAVPLPVMNTGQQWLDFSIVDLFNFIKHFAVQVFIPMLNTLAKF